MRPKNEDTYYISDDAAGGKGFSSESLNDPDRGASSQGARGAKSEDGKTSHATGGGMSKPSKWDARKAARNGDSSRETSAVGFYGVYDGHCGRLASEVSLLLFNVYSNDQLTYFCEL